MKKIAAIILALVMCLALTACGGVDKQSAVDAYNQAATAFNDASAIINEHINQIDDNTYNAFVDMAALLQQYNQVLTEDQELEQDTLDEMTEFFKSVTQWSADVKTELEEALA